MRTYDPSQPLFSLHIPKTGGSSLEYVLASWFNHSPFPVLRNHPKLARILTIGNLDFYLQRLLGCGFYFYYKDHARNATPRKVPLGQGYGLTLAQKQPECVHGHFRPSVKGEGVFDVYPEAQQFITVLRDPLEMHISLYHYTKRMLNEGFLYFDGKKQDGFKFQSLDEWVIQRNFFLLECLPWQLSEENFKDVINKNFVYIGVMENFQHSLDQLAERLGFQPMKVPQVNVTPRSERPSEQAVQIFRDKYQLEYAIYHYAKTLNK